MSISMNISARPSMTSPEAAALTLAAGALATRLRDVRAALILPAGNGALAVRFTIGFTTTDQDRVADVRIEPEWLSGGIIRNPNRELGRALRLRQSVVVPLSPSEPLAGALLVDSPHLDAASVSFACTVSDHLAGTLAPHHPIEDLRANADLATTLLRLSAEVTSTSPLNEVLHRICTVTVQLIGCDRSGTMLWSQRRGGFVPAADIGTPADVAAAFASSSYQFGDNIPFGDRLQAGHTVSFDVSTPDLQARRLLNSLQLETMVIVPLVGRNRQLGSLTASWEHRHQVMPEELNLLNGLARYAAVAIDSAQLFDRAAKGAEFRDALSQLSLTVHTMTDPDEMLRFVCRRIRELFRTDAAFVARREKEGLVISQVDAQNPERLIGTVFAGDDEGALVTQAWRSGQPVVSNDAGDASRLPPDLDIRSLIAVPIFGRRLAFGALVLADPRPHRFNNDMVEEVAMAGILAGSAVETAQLVEELRRNSDALAERSARLEEHTAALESKNEEMEDLLFIASHDLRAPLINIEGFVHELQQSVVALQARSVDGVAELNEPMDFVRHGVARMSAMINVLIDLSALSTNPLRRTTVDVAALVERLKQERRADLESGRISLSVEPLAKVHADPTRLAQVFEHLIDNAIKYMGTSAERQIVVGNVRDHEGVRFFVTDSGSGMSPQEVELAFRLFRRGRQQVPGAGLGLTRVKKIIEKHGGRVWLQSHPAQGTTVWFTLPGAAVDLSAAHAPQPA